MLSDTAQRLIHPERLTERGALIVCIGWAVSQSGLMAGGASRPKVSGTRNGPPKVPRRSGWRGCDDC